MCTPHNTPPTSHNISISNTHHRPYPYYGISLPALKTLTLALDGAPTLTIPPAAITFVIDILNNDRPSQRKVGTVMQEETPAGPATRTVLYTAGEKSPYAGGQEGYVE